MAKTPVVCPQCRMMIWDVVYDDREEHIIVVCRACKAELLRAVWAPAASPPPTVIF